MSTNEILIVTFLLVSFISKIFILAIGFKYKILENLAVATVCFDFLTIIAICDYIFKWGWFF